MKPSHHPDSRAAAVLLALSLVLVSACGGDGTGPYASGGGGGGSGASSGRTLSIATRDDFFSPKLDTVTVGSTVTWTNEGNTEHTTTSDGGLWDSGNLASAQGQGAYGGGSSSGQSFQYTFSQTGEFPYHCKNHGAAGGIGMAGTVVVVP